MANSTNGIISDLYQINTDIGFAQSGTQGAKRSRLVIRTSSGLVTAFSPDELRDVLVFENPNYVSVFEDFFILPTSWTTSVANASAAAAGSGAAALNGTVRLTTDTALNDFVALTRTVLQYNAAGAMLLFEAGVTNITNTSARALEVGFNNALTKTNGRTYTTISASPVVVAATDSVMFGFDSAGTNWFALASKAGVAQGVDTGVAPVAGTEQFFKIIVDNDGTARYYINGTLVATITSAITASASLTPWVSLNNKTAATARIVDVDYILAARNR